MSTLVASYYRFTLLWHLHIGAKIAVGAFAIVILVCDGVTISLLQLHTDNLYSHPILAILSAIAFSIGVAILGSAFAVYRDYTKPLPPGAYIVARKLFTDASSSAAFATRQREGMHFTRGDLADMMSRTAVPFVTTSGL